jgi:UDP-N-acetylmuramoylalanine--D-glutamate ligase
MDKRRNYIPARVSILGAARSGCAAARFLSSRKALIFISDSCSKDKLARLLEMGNCSGFSSEYGGHTGKILDADVIILSPGVPSDLPILAQAREKGIPVWSEIELAFRFSSAAYLAVTGSTGKSTTVSMLGSILKAGGTDHAVAGNIGIPLIDVATNVSEKGFIAAEISSFQLENIDCFKPKAAVILNLLKNHLDRYDNEEAYYEAKKNIARNSDKNDCVILNAADPRLVEWAGQIRHRTNVLWFGSGSIPGDGLCYHDGMITSRINGVTEKILDVKSMKLEGVHNYENACAAATAAKFAGIDNGSIAAGLSGFAGLEHRLEFVAEVDGVRYFNDSKSTTAESIICAVSAFGHNVHLIAGGRDKGCDFSAVNSAIKKNVKEIRLIGEASRRMAAEWNGCAPLYIEKTLDEAVENCRASSVPGDVVVFSPGCSSFDMFRNFEHRGEVFKRIVLDLTKESRPE